MILRLSALAAALALSACATVSTVPWMRDGERVGTLEKIKTADGFTYRYSDGEGALQVLEYRDAGGELMEGACTYRYGYDGKGRQVLLQAFDRDGAPATTGDGWRQCRTAYAADPKGAEVVENSYCDGAGALVETTQGYAVERIEYEVDSERQRRIEFLTTRRVPAAIQYRGNQGVSSVTFAYLRGLTPICMAVLRDPSGGILKRIKLSGSSYRSVITGNDTVGTVYYVPRTRSYVRIPRRPQAIRRVR